MNEPHDPTSHVCCTDLAEQLLLFRDGDLGPKETEHLRQHLHRCPMCLELLQSYDEVCEILQRLQPVEVPKGLCDRLKKRICRDD